MLGDADEQTVNALEQAVFAEELGQGAGQETDQQQAQQSTQLPPMFSTVLKSSADVN